MNEKVGNAKILQAITELTDQVQNNSKKLELTEERLTEKINILDSKLSILSDSLLKTQADVKILKNAE